MTSTKDAPARPKLPVQQLTILGKDLHLPLLYAESGFFLLAL